MNNMFLHPDIITQRKTITKGATLVEILVYVVIVTLLLSVLVSMLFAISRFERHASALRYVESSGVTALEKISREVRSATSIDVIQSTFGATLGKLVLAVPISGGGSKTVEFSVLNGVVRTKENGVDFGALTLSQASTTQLIFRIISNGSIQGVRIELGLQSGEGDYLKAKNFYTTATARTTY